MSLLNNTCFDIMEKIGKQVERIRKDKEYKSNHTLLTKLLLPAIFTNNCPIYYYIDREGKRCPKYLYDAFDLSSYDNDNIIFYRTAHQFTPYANPSTYPEYARENGCIPDGEGGWEGYGIVQTGYN